MGTFSREHLSQADVELIELTSLFQVVSMNFEDSFAEWATNNAAKPYYLRGKDILRRVDLLIKQGSFLSEQEIEDIKHVVDKLLESLATGEPRLMSGTTLVDLQCRYFEQYGLPPIEESVTDRLLRGARE